ncbi:hypothetical protein LTR91_022550 [Friedmanniomyces endolithicus]|uniref:Uncharacterized protein n=1 Tax=Friedmanniomyces endolithicus TaxID=329885 RepID=A0AAN6H4L1_9PEZI|nr:hypothetical protein LTR94_023930 [Friedmanniomyces endolithicus]KAK0771030.1 hypothetical protein LTR59_016265 [Friedmanniomyces endolithicus]KAK0773309.1 hypothetical protein LTR75_017164 [Friedmanniomyces endolithicus]KAK0774229.1 hypothetical protein LTR38_016281 [Friedmanniomyces endolithicus]KAK0826042.1 hypothetical protein LTR03_017284 [Friedmanniomyces endolithicus]
MEQNNSALTLLSHLSAYSLAGCLMEHFVVFHSWQLTTSHDELQRLQTPTGMRTLYIYVVPKIITTLLACYLAWTTNQTGLKWCVACLTVSWVSSFTVQIPLQLQIQQTGDRKALVTLVWTDWYARALRDRVLGLQKFGMIGYDLEGTERQSITFLFYQG